jgi:hypothetical protein
MYNMVKVAPLNILITFSSKKENSPTVGTYRVIKTVPQWAHTGWSKSLCAPDDYNSEGYM